MSASCHISVQGLRHVLCAEQRTKRVQVDTQTASSNKKLMTGERLWIFLIGLSKWLCSCYYWSKRHLLGDTDCCIFLKLSRRKCGNLSRVITSGNEKGNFLGFYRFKIRPHSTDKTEKVGGKRKKKRRQRYSEITQTGWGLVYSGIWLFNSESRAGKPNQSYKPQEAIERFHDWEE